MHATIPTITNAAALCVFSAFSSTVAAAADTQSANIWNVGNLSIGTCLNRLSSAGSLAGEYMCYFPDRTDNDGSRLASTTYRRLANQFVVEEDMYLSTGTTLYQNGNGITLGLAAVVTTGTNLTPAAANIPNVMYFGCAISGGVPAALTALKYSEIIVYPSNISTNRLKIENNIEKAHSIESYVISSKITENQGYCTDGTYHYTALTNGASLAIRKRDSVWAIVAENTDPLNGIVDVDHLGGCSYYDGKIYVAGMDYNGGAGATDQCILIFDADDLSRLDVIDISAQGGDTSGLVVVSADNTIYVVDFDMDTGENYIAKYNLTTHAFIANITLAAAIDGMQGIAYYDGYFYISSYQTDTNPDTNIVYKVKKDGSTIENIFQNNSNILEFEDIEYASGELRLFIQDTVDVGKGWIFHIE
jgi:hypothetical protein